MSLTTSLLGAIGAVLLLHIDLAAALNPLSDWHDGIATYYGGPADNMDPYSPSYGTKDVRPCPCLLHTPMQKVTASSKLMHAPWDIPCKPFTSILMSCEAVGIGEHCDAKSTGMQGACGYYELDKTKWPYWSVGALTPTNTFAKTGPAQACG